ncbi:MAG: serine hydrolase [Bacteroidetes bacterium]|nr:serine hydrolase [Bacteroidota bacterium]
MYRFRIPIVISLLVSFPLLFCSNKNNIDPENQRTTSTSSRSDSLWVDSVFKSLTPDQRLAQLFMIPAYSKKGNELAYLKNVVKKYNIGGIIFMQGGPVRQAVMCNQLQEAAQTPMLIAIDGEWGLAMRLDSTISFPKQMALGAISDPNWVYKMGKEIGRECNRLGIHINFAPVVDVNNNRSNPVINYRSFGENKKNVANKGIAYMKGMQDNQVIACAKHFPGHGDTDTDSHLALPVINHSRERIDSLELYPFRQLIKAGVISIMVAHLHIPALDPEEGSVTTLSEKVVTGLLRDSLEFKGLVITDALNMGGVANGNNALTIDVRALLAGNDILLFPQNIEAAIKAINEAIESGKISRGEVDLRVKKVLYAKFWAGLNKYKPIDTNNLIEDLNSNDAIALNRQLAEKSLTVLINKDEILPLKRLDTLKIASVSVGYNSKTEFQEMMDLFAEVDHFNIGDQSDASSTAAKLSAYNTVIIGIHSKSQYASKRFGIPSAADQLIGKLYGKCRIILDLMGNPYGLFYLENIDKVDAFVVGYDKAEEFQRASAQFIFGAIGANGRLPVSPGKWFKEGDGLEVSDIGRLKYALPEECGIKSEWFSKVDSIANDGIAKGAYPGCQIIAAKDGKVIYYKSFGHHTYEKTREVKNTDIYDLASVTKVAGTTLALMKLVDDSLIEITHKLGEFYSEVDSSNKDNIRLKDILSHRAKLKPWIPFYTETLKDGKPADSIYSTKYSEEFPNQVAENLYCRKDYPDTMYRRIFCQSLRTRTDYRYSDLGFIMFYRMIQECTGIQEDTFLYQNFYNRMGLSTLRYRPLDKFPKSEIVPTEDDKTFRHQLLQGYVHDPGAAMMGGVCGHAGLFSNANDLAKLMQMMMLEGKYGGYQYITPETFNYFNTCHFKVNRRGLGFDKREASGKGSMYKNVSDDSFGHTGFTGTMVWADPTEKIVFVFLSNRVYPVAENRKIIDMDIRQKIQEAIYEAMHKAVQDEKVMLGIQ